MDVTKVKAIIFDVGQGGKIPGKVEKSFGPLMIISGRGFYTTDLTNSIFDNNRNIVKEQMKSLVEVNGYVLVGNPRIVRERG